MTHELPSMEHKFHLNVRGAESGLVWTGDFTYRRPNIGLRSSIETMRARLCGDLATISPEIELVNTALAHLHYTLTSVPEWWKNANNGFALFDANVILEVYTKCIDFESEWQKKVHGGNPKSVEKGASTDGTTAEL